MRLVDVYANCELSCRVLFKLLSERRPNESISHRAMPTWTEHCAFVRSRPYRTWYLVEVGGVAVGATYLTMQHEIGIGILRDHQRNGYAREAVQRLMALHPGRFLANINPANEASIALFRKLGFGGPIQITLERPA